MGTVPRMFVFLSCILSVLAVCPHQRSGLTRWGTLSIAENATVTIPAGQSVLLDQTPPRLTSISVLGELIFADANISLTTQFLRVGTTGKLWIGSTEAGCSINSKISITFYGGSGGSSEMGTDGSAALGSKGLAIMTGGSISIVGTVTGPTWTRLTKSASAGASQITVEDAVTWKAGDKIVIATTDFPYSIPWEDNYPQSINWLLGRGSPDQNEERTVVSVSGNVITLDAPLTYLHWGLGFERAEVGLLNRNILIQGSPEDDLTRFGGHIMIRHVTYAVIQGVEMTRMGQHGVLGRYPLHFHAAKDAFGLGYTIRQNSVHHAYQRCYVVHFTSGVLLEENVAFNNTGHCYFLEDGSERGNTFHRNLGIGITPVASDDPLTILPTDVNPAMFWITNPNNSFTENSAVGGFFGYWFSMPETPTGISALDFPPSNRIIRPRWTPLGTFDANVAHSSFLNGLHIDDMVLYDTLDVELASYNPRMGPYNASDDLNYSWFYPMADALFTNFVTYKNRQYGAWSRGGPFIFENMTAADNMRGYNSPPDPSILRNSHIIGETDNIGTPLEVEGERSRPSRWDNAEPIKGWETYDNGGAQFCENVIFENFTTNEIRPAGALSNLECGPFLLQARDRVRNVKFVNANEVIVTYCEGNGDCGRSWALYDGDGSVIGHPGWIVSENSTLLSDSSCVYKPDWSAYACPPFPEGRFVQLGLNIRDTQKLNGTIWKYLFGTSDGKYPVSAKQDRVIYYSVENSGKFFDSHGALGISESATTMITQVNMKPRHTYAVKFAEGIPTPPVIEVGLQSAFRSDWVYLAIPYPASHFPLNITLSKWSGPEIFNLKKVSKLSDLLSIQQYYYDSQLEFVYLRMESTSTDFRTLWGFTSLDGADGLIVRIEASCMTNPDTCQPSKGVAATQVFDSSTQETLLGASLQYCQAKPTQLSGGGIGSFYLNSVNRTLIYHLTYDLPENVQVENIHFKAGSVGTVGTILHTAPYVDNPVTYTVPLSKDNWLKLLTGDIYVALETSDTPEFIRGQIGVLGNSQQPPPFSAVDPCSGFLGNSLEIYSDSFPSWESADAFQYVGPNVNVLFNSTNRLCGNLGIQLGFKSDGVVFGQWPGVTLDTTTYKYLQFYARLGNNNDSTIGLAVGIFNDSDHTYASYLPILPDHVDNFVIDDQLWTQVKIPLNYLGMPENSQEKFLGIGLGRADGGYYGGEIFYYLDEIRIVTGKEDARKPVLTADQIYQSKPICKDKDSMTSFTVPNSGIPSSGVSSENPDPEESSANVLSLTVLFAMIIIINTAL